ncbi:protein chromatin remodeling 24 [Quercus suber]|uniref:Protein chromatin remodeling 24 n=1 Tax=Quercus suber TaxID=58331 RepID=A0AAW0JXX3_QUESU
MASSELEVKPIIVIDDDNIPQFSGITDSNSPLEKEKPTKVKIERRQCLCKVRDNASDDERVVVDEPNFVDIADFDSPLKVKIEGRRRLSIVSTQDNDSDDRRVLLDESNIVDIADFDLPSKVKIEGRRSLSTGSTQENNSDVKRLVLDKPNFVDIAEFDSPLKVKIEGRRSLSIVSTRDNDSDDRRMVLDEPNFVDIAEFDSPSKVKTEGRQSLSIVSTRDNDKPNFVDIAEFDLPLKVKTEGRRSLSIVSTQDNDSNDRRMVLDEPNFVDIAEFDSPLMVKTEGGQSLSIVSTRDNDSNDRKMVLDEPNFVDIVEFDLPLKVKTEGRRSLSIVSTRDNDSNDRRMVLDEPNFFDIAEFDSPLKVKTEGRRSLSIVSTRDNDSNDRRMVLDEPNFVDIAEFDSPLMVKTEDDDSDDRRVVLDEPNFVDIAEFDSPLKVKIDGRRRLSIVSTQDNDSDDRRAVLDEPNFVDIAEFDSPLKVKIEGRRSLSIVSTRNNDSDDRRMVLDEPNFVDIADFDSPQPKHVVKGGRENGGGNENKDVLNDLLLFYWIVFLNVFVEKEKPMKVKIEGRQCLSKISTQDNDSADNKPVLGEPNFVHIADFDLPPPKNVIEGGCENGVGNEIKDILNVLLLFYWSIFLKVFVEKEKPTKVKIEGRQRLCEVLTLDNDSDDKRVVLDEPDFVDVADLDFPPPKNVVESGGENEIKDILNDLSGTCDFLPIEKKRAPKRIGPSEDCVKLVKNRKMSEVEKADLPEYPSVGSLFLPSDMLDSPLDVIKTLENVVEEQEEKSDLWNVSTGNGVHKVNNIDERLNRNEPKILFSKGLPFMSEVKEEEVNYLHIDSEDDDDENDCVALGGKRMIKEVERKGSKSKDEYDDSDGVNCDGLKLPEYMSAGSSFPPAFDTLESSFDLIKRAEGRVENIVKEQEKKSDLCNIFEDNKVHGVKNNSERLNRNEPKKEGENLIYKRLPFAFEVEKEDNTYFHIDSEDDEDEDDCFVLTGKRMVEVERQETKSKDECADSDGVDMLDDNFVVENDGYITLNGPKSTYKLPGKIANMQYHHQCDGLRMPEYVSAGSSFPPTSDVLDSSSDMIKNIGGRVRNVVEKQKGKSDLLDVSKGNRVYGVNNTSERLNRNEPKTVSKKLMSKGLPFVFEVTEEEVTHLHIDSADDEDEDDCVVLSGKRMVKEIKKQETKSKDECADSDGVDVLDDYTNGFVEESDGDITLNGPKSTYKLSGKIAKMQYPHHCDGLRMREYVSAGSSFLPTSDMLDSSLNMIKKVGGRVRNVVEKQKGKSDLLNVFEVNRILGVKNEGERLKINEPMKVDEKLISKGQPFVSKVKEEEVNYLHIDSKGDKFVGRVHGTKKHGEEYKPQPERVDKKLVPIEQSLVSKVEERMDDDEDDACVILSGKRTVKDVKREGSKCKEEYDDLDGVDVLDDYTDDSVAENDCSITLDGPKSTYKLPGKIAKMLYPHQCDGLRWLWSLHCQGKGGILGDDMGLGKTMQICGFLAGLFHSHLINRVLVVAPKTLLPHWIKELSVVGLYDNIREYYGACPKARQYELQYILQDKGVLLTTYDIVRNNSKSLQGGYDFDDKGSEDSVTWDYMILDEAYTWQIDGEYTTQIKVPPALTLLLFKLQIGSGRVFFSPYRIAEGTCLGPGHLIKNPSTQRAKSLLEIPSAHRIIISGTPLQNNLKELWALVNFCCPDLLGDNKWFKEKFECAILRGNEKEASDTEKHIGSEVAKELRENIQPYFLRRLKNEVFDEEDSKTIAKLSKKNEVIVWLRLNSCQRQLYETFLKSELVLSAFGGSPLAAITCDGLKLPEYMSAGSSFPPAFDTLESSFDLIKRAEGRVENIVKEQEKKSDLCNIFEDNKVHGVKNNSERLNRNEPKKEGENLIYKRLPFAFEVEKEDNTYFHIDSEDDEDEDDCFVLTGKRMVEVERQETKSKDECADSDGVDMLDDNFVVENDGYITLNGPKSTYKLPGKIANMQYHHQCDGLRMPEYVSAGSSFPPTSDVLDSSSDMIKNIGGRVRNVVEKQKGKSDLLDVSKGNRVYGVNNTSERLNRNEPKTILKKICDDPLLLTKRAAADVLEGMESMLKPEDVHVAEKLAMHIADVVDTDDLEEKHNIVSCKISFILSLLVGNAAHGLIDSQIFKLIAQYDLFNDFLQDNLIQEGRCVLIFSQTRKMLNLIQDFQKGVGASIFLLTSRVGGLGLTLTRADRVIVVDPAWNPSTDNQSVDRAYRIGQTKDVIVYRLMTCGTVEEKIYRKQVKYISPFSVQGDLLPGITIYWLKIFKGGLFKTATEHKEQIRYFNQQDLRDLFSLPEQGFDVSVTQKQLHKEHDCHHIMDDYLKAHIEFLQTQGIAGVSHHSLLFSKTEPVQLVKEEEEVTAPVQVVKEEEEEISKKGTTFVGCLPSSSSLECIVDGAAYDFKPKDVSMNKKRCSLDSGSNLTKFEIEEKINCLSQKLANKPKEDLLFHEDSKSTLPTP